MSSKSNKDSVVISYDKFNVEDMSCTELKDGIGSIGSKGPKIAFPEFTINGINQPLLIQFPWINISQGGVPKISDWCKSDEDRKTSGVKIPLDESIPESAKLLQVMRDFDKKCNSESFRMKLLGKYYKKYKYSPVVKNDTKNNEDEDDIIEPSNGPKYHPSLKLKLETDYNTGEIKTKLYVDKDNTRNWVEQNVKDINEFSDIFCYRSDVHVIIKVAKFWVHPLTKQDPQWGATFKLIKAQVKPPNNSIINNPSAADFLNSDEESEEKPKSSKKVVVKSDSNEEENEEEKLPPIATKKVAQVESDDDDESEEESSKEKSLPTPPPTTPSPPPTPINTKTTKKVAQVESDDDDESEEKPSSPIVTKKIAQVESDDDSDDNEEPEPPPIKKQVAKKVAKVESDDDSDDDEEPEPPPIKKPVAKKVAKVESDDDEEPEPPPIKKPVAKNTGGRGGKSKSS